MMYSDEEATAYDATKTPGSALLFRKDLEHEGEVLEAGEKHILSVNVSIALSLLPALSQSSSQPMRVVIIYSTFSSSGACRR